MAGKKYLPLCTFYGNECFYTKFHNQTRKSECECFPQCNEVVYKYYIDRQRKFTSDEITDFCNVFTPHFHYIWHFEDPNFDVLRLKNLTAHSQDHTINVCKKYISTQFARIHIRLDGTTHLRRLQSLKYSSGDKFAIIGGTFGLFTGFSFIALFEALHWILVTVFKLVWLKRKPVLPEKNKEDPMVQEMKIMKKKLLQMEKNETNLKEALSKHESIIKNQNEALTKQESIIKNLNERLGALENNPSPSKEESSQEMIVEDVELDIAQ